MPKVGRRSDNSLSYEIDQGDNVLRNAPFGTSYTPLVRTRIVGGKSQFVLDRANLKEDPQHVTVPAPSRELPGTNASYGDSLQERLHAKRQDKSYVNEGQGRRQHVVQESTTDRLTAADAGIGNNANLGAQRPSWNSLTVLPPISSRQIPAGYGVGRNSGMNPSEFVGAKRSHTPESGYSSRNNAAENGLSRRGMQDSHALAKRGQFSDGNSRDDGNSSNENFEQELYGLPSPSKPEISDLRLPARMNRSEEAALLRQLHEQLRSVDTTHALRDVYVELTRYDSSLSGWIAYEDFVLTLMRMKIFVNNNNLRAAASMFLSQDQPGKVNYEKLLSYLASAMRPPPAATRSNSRSQQARGQNRVPVDSELQHTAGQQLSQHHSRPASNANKKPPGAMEKDSYAASQGKLMHVVEEQLMSMEDGMDLEKLRQEFVMSDRLHRQTLSHQQIKEIVYRMRIPLQESVINHILDRCQTHGDGQYSWQDFINFLERVQPAHTGLDIKPSKRPAEYARHYPEPDASWPQAPGNDERRYVQPDSVRRGPAPMTRTESEVTPRGREQVGGARHRDSIERSLSPPLQPRIQSRLFRQQRRDATGDDWFNRFTHMAEALYRNDYKGDGLLPTDEAKWLITKYNDVYQLGLPELTITDVLQRRSHGDGSSVEIDSLLKSLATSIK